MNKDRWIGLVLIACGAIMCILTNQITTTGMAISNDIGSKFFPYLASVGLALCGVGVFATAKKEEKEEPFMPKGGYRRMAVLLGVLLIYVVLLNYVGFMIASPILLYVLVVLLAGEKKIKPIYNIIFSIVMTAVVYVLFVYVLNILLPVGSIIGF